MSLNRLYLLLPPSLAFLLSGLFLKCRGFFFRNKTFSWRSKKWRQLYFSNPVGLAGGLDKSAQHIQGWWTYGPSFIEIGTLTPLPQKQNLGSTLKRDHSRQALWNHMGFPNAGLQKAEKNLKSIQQRHTPIFVSIGKNRQTSLQNSIKDYLTLIEGLHLHASAFVLNISSPNTTDLRKLFDEEFFLPLLKSVHDKLESYGSIPLLLKLSPDFSNSEFKRVVLQSEPWLDGWIVCNTTLNKSPCAFPDHGGLSGSPLRTRSEELLSSLIEILGEKRQGRLIISSGGVMNHQDIVKRLDMGADLVQVYSALVFQGPSFFEKIYKKEMKL